MDDHRIRIRIAGDLVIVSIKGLLTGRVIGSVCNRALQLLEKHPASVVLDLTGLYTIEGWSGADLGVLMACVEDIRDRGGDLKLAVNERQHRLLDLLGFPRLFEILPSDSMHELLQNAKDYEEEPVPIRFRFVEGIAIVTVDDTLDDEVADLVRAAFEKLVEKKRYRIVFVAPDLEDTRGDELQTLLSALDALRDAGGFVKIVAAGGKLSEALDLLGHSVFSSVDGAIDSFLTGGD